MNRLIAVVMGLTLLAIVAEIAQNADHWWIEWSLLAAAASAIGLAVARTVPNAVRLGSAADSRDEQTRLARATTEITSTVAAMIVLLGLQSERAALTFGF